MTRTQGTQPPPELRGETLWRYLSFVRFLWLIQNQLLWLARGDLLGDPWEGTLSRSQVDGMIASERSDSNSPYKDALAARYDLAMIAIRLQRSFHANCWIESAHESFAMWRAYCASPESVAIRTTVGALRDSIDPEAELVPVRYVDDESRPITPLRLASRKRPMFEAENEVRIVYTSNAWKAHPWINPPLERRMPWPAIEQIEQIRLHPASDATFAATARRAVADVSSSLAERVSASEIAQSPWTRFFDGL